MRTPRYCYGMWPELEYVELGARAAYAYDEDFSIAYRFAAAGGLARRDASRYVLDLQTSWQRARRTAK